IEDLVQRQAIEIDRGKREKLLHQAQQLIHEKVMHAPLLELANVAGYGPRVAESAVGLIPYMSSSAPYEELRVQGKEQRRGGLPGRARPVIARCRVTALTTRGTECASPQWASPDRRECPCDFQPISLV